MLTTLKLEPLLLVRCACGCKLVHFHFYPSVSLLPQLWDALTSSPCVNHQAVYRSWLKKEKRSHVYPAGFSELCSAKWWDKRWALLCIYLSVSFCAASDSLEASLRQNLGSGRCNNSVYVCALLSSLICYFRKTKQRTVLHDWGAKFICVTSTTFCGIRGFHTLISCR